MPSKKRDHLTKALMAMLLILIALFIYSTYGTYRMFSEEQKKMQVFYITDAGINQAIWYLSTPGSLGGFGPAWRTKGFERFYSVGKYSISVIDGILPGEIIIISTGEADNLKQMAEVSLISGKSLPGAFSYSLFSDNRLDIGGETNINGNVFCSDNIVLKDNTRVMNGMVFVAPGYTVERSGNAVFEQGKSSRPVPSVPVLDTTYYHDNIVRARSGGAHVIKGDMTLKDHSLKGRTIYVDGNVRISGNISGPGIIVATRNIFIEGKGSILGVVSFISNGSITISGSRQIRGEASFYSRQKTKIAPDSTVKGRAAYLSPTKLVIGSNSNVFGLVYSPEVSLEKNSSVKGSMVANNYGGGELKDVNITYNDAVLPPTVIGFNVGSNIMMKRPGSWKEVKKR